MANVVVGAEHSVKVNKVNYVTKFTSKMGDERGKGL